MPIEFRCSRCGKLLRTGDETAGRQAQCPECGSLTEVPSGAGGAVPPIAPLGPSDASGEAGTTASPFAAGTPPLPSETLNPYQSPYGEVYAVPAAQRVSGPAIGLIVTAILGMCWQVLTIVVQIASFVALGAHQQRGNNDIEFIAGPAVMFAVGAIGLILSILVLIGALKMKRLDGYGWSITSAILAMIPCYWPCCLLGLPFGIWALVVLNDESVKAAFRR